jgi:hypothetical protein
MSTKTIHTLTIGSETFTRESASRKYAAALVSTVTEESIRFEAARAARCAVEADKLEAVLAADLAARGTTAAAVEAEYGALRAEYQTAQDAQYNGSGGTRAARDAAFARCYDRAGAYGLSEKIRAATSKRSAAEVRPFALGSAVVLSWHHSVALASKAAGSEAAQSAKHGQHFRAYSVRTDIVTRERATRASRTAVAS